MLCVLGFCRAFDYNGENDFTRLVCWAHVKRNLDKKINGLKTEYKDAIDSDIETLQLCSTISEFEQQAKLFVKKWKAIKRVEVSQLSLII